jgi:hypothetical protein
VSGSGSLFSPSGQVSGWLVTPIKTEAHPACDFEIVQRLQKKNMTSVQKVHGESVSRLRPVK